MSTINCILLLAVMLAVGCSADRAVLPSGSLPKAGPSSDTLTVDALSRTPLNPLPAVESKPAQFELPNALPGSTARPLTIPRFEKDTPFADRERIVNETYPQLTPVGWDVAPAANGSYSLADLQSLARANSPAIHRAMADADASYGQVIQAGLHPNPTVGYQADQIQPSLRIPPGSSASGAGQQGGYINQLIKTAGKLSLAQQVAGFDYINALVAVRKAEMDVMAAVRSAYFTALVAQQNLEVNKALADMADEVYRLQLKQVAAGTAAGYEPLQLYAQAIQARNSVAQADATTKAAWKQLAAAIGQPDLPRGTLTGRADAFPPLFDPNELALQIRDNHTDILTAANTIAQAQRNLTLQKRMPIPDVLANTYQQYDNAAQTYQFGVQVGIQLPISDRNQGNIRTAQSRIAAASQQYLATQNALSGRLAEALGRYTASVTVTANYRDKILPGLTQAYRAVVQRYQLEPDKVSFNDIVVAQQNLAQALQSYLTSLDNQWKAVVDLATVAQLDELYPLSK